MPTPSIQTLVTDAQQVLNLDSISAVRSVVAVALANANTGTPLNPNLTTQQLWNEFYQVVTKPKSDIESIIANQLMKFLFAPPAPGGAGANKQVIFNDGGVLAGDPQFLWDKTTNQLTVAGTVQVTGGVAGQGALIGRDGGSGGATYGSNTGNTNLNAPAGGGLRFNVNNGVFAGMFDTSGNMGILNNSPFSGTSNGLTIGTVGTGSAKQIALQMANCYARMRERNVVNDFSITTNINVDNVLDDNTRPSWMIRLGAGSDLFSVFRAAVGSTSFTTLATVNPSGDINLIGNLVPTNGKGIDFSATPSGSGTMTSELLSDYEEGTWTATLRGTVSDPTTPLTSTCKYTKIGRQVFVEGVIDGNTTGASGQVFISGLPFSAGPGSFERPGSVQMSNIATFTGYATAYITGSGATINFYSSSSGAALGNVIHNPGVSRTIWFAVTYTVA